MSEQTSLFNKHELFVFQEGVTLSDLREAILKQHYPDLDEYFVDDLLLFLWEDFVHCKLNPFAYMDKCDSIIKLSEVRRSLLLPFGDKLYATMDFSSWEAIKSQRIEILSKIFKGYSDKLHEYCVALDILSSPEEWRFIEIIQNSLWYDKRETQDYARIIKDAVELQSPFLYHTKNDLFRIYEEEMPPIDVKDILKSMKESGIEGIPEELLL